MAWTVPRTWVAAETVTAALGNVHWRDNFTALRAGGIVVASQAAGDFLFASSSTQIGRLAAVSSRTPRDNGTAWEMFNMAGQVAWPVGSIYEAVVATNPATLLGFGTWVAFGVGRVIVGIDAGNPSFDTVEETSGAKTVTLVTAELPIHTHVQDAHTHTQTSHNHTQNSHTHSVSGMGNTLMVDVDEPSSTVMDDTGTKATTSTTATNNPATATNQSTIATNQATGSGGAHNNLQAYIVCYRWKRTA